MDWRITAVLGALGVGGVALAFAAQDTIGNFFGSITVLFDRPFGIGDWIIIGDVEGTVERVGFRSTRVRTFYNSMVTIPNSMMVNTQVDNYGARRYRRVKVMLSVTYSTPPEKIDAFCEGIRELIRLHPYTRKDYYHVYFNQFADSSLDILLYAFFEVPDWGTELRERHRLFVDILRLADRLGIEFAFPTRTVWLERSRDAAAATERLTIIPGKDDPDRVGLGEAAKVFEETYGALSGQRAPVVIETTPRSKRAARDDAGSDRKKDDSS
jgi:MscS family membrane protein